MVIQIECTPLQASTISKAILSYEASQSRLYTEGASLSCICLDYLEKKLENKKKWEKE